MAGERYIEDLVIPASGSLTVGSASTFADSVTMTKSGGNAWFAIHETATNNTIAQTAALRATLTSGSIADAFGAGLAFQNRTGAGSAVRMGILAFVRNGADNTADFIVRPDAAGSGAEKFRVGSDGKVTAPGYIINTGIRDVTATGAASAPELGDGTHTPTAVAVTNADSATGALGVVTRVGNNVHVEGEVAVDATATTTLTKVGIPLPVASAFSAVANAKGFGVCTNVVITTGVDVYADATNDRLELSFTSGSTGSHTIKFTADYVII